MIGGPIECDLLVYSIPYRDGISVTDRLILDAALEAYSLYKFVAVQTGSVLTAHIDEMMKLCKERLSIGIEFGATAEIEVHNNLYLQSDPIILNTPAVETIELVMNEFQNGLILAAGDIDTQVALSAGKVNLASGLTDGVQYFYKFFPYTTSGGYTDSPDAVFNATPNPVPLGNVSGMSAVAAGNGKLAIKYADPAATIVTDSITMATWAKTVVVVKEGSYATDPDDADAAFRQVVTTRNQYATTALTATGLKNGTTYYVSFFPVSTDDAINTNTANRVSGVADRMEITVAPKQSGTLTYNKAAQTPSWDSGYDSTKMTMSATAQTNVGTYTGYLENRLVEIARSCKRYHVLTKKTFQNTVMKESQKAVMEEFVDNVRILINTLGYKVMDPLLQTNGNSSATESEELFLSSGNASAIGIVTAEGFVVFKGAVVNQKSSVKSLTPGMKALRDKLFADGKVDDLVTTEDLLFSSSSAAANFVLGYPVSGPRTWKTKDGRTLKEIEGKATVH